MIRKTNVDMTTACKKPETALNRFFKKYPDLEDEWRDSFEYMISEGVENFTDDRMADGSHNDQWRYSLWFEDHDGSYYIAVVLRDFADEPEQNTPAWKTRKGLYRIHETRRGSDESYSIVATGDEVSEICRAKNESNGYIEGVGGDRSYSAWAVLETYLDNPDTTEDTPEEITETTERTAPKFEAFISYGNTKTGIPSFNLLAGNQSHPYDGTAPHKFDGSELRQVCGTCNTDCPGCYAKAMTRYDATFTHYAENTYMVYSDPVALVHSLEAQLYASPVTAPRVFRLHDSGDFATWEYFTEIMAMIRRHPETQYGAYTKRADLVNRYGLENLPDNFSLQCSPWEGHCEPIGDLPQFIYDDGTHPELARLPHCPAVDKNGKRTGVQCKDCLHCYFSKRGQRWAVYAH